MKVDITHLLQIINFSSPFRRFEIKNSLCRPIMVANNILNLEPPRPPPHAPPPQKKKKKQLSAEVMSQAITDNDSKTSSI